MVSEGYLLHVEEKKQLDDLESWEQGGEQHPQPDTQTRFIHKEGNWNLKAV